MASLLDFTAPRTWTAAELVSKAIMDTHVRDNELWLQAVAEVAGRKGMYVADDCLFLPGNAGAAPLLDGGVSGAVSGAAAANTLATTSAAHPGQLQLSTGTDTTGRAALIGQTDQIQLGTNDFRYSGSLSLPTLSDATNTYTARMGLGDSAAAESVDYVGFRYTHSVNTAKWQGVCRSNSVESTVDTAITADTAFHTFGFTVNAAGTSVQFYIDGTAAGSTIVTNIPNTSARLLTFLPGFIAKSAGTTARTMLVDSYTYLMSLAR